MAKIRNKITHHNVSKHHELLRLFFKAVSMSTAYCWMRNECTAVGAAHGSVVSSDTMLQARWSWVQLSISSMDLFIFT
jgi:hypothetical protein